MPKKVSPLSHPAFLSFWLGSSFASLGTKMQQLLMAWQLWKITEDPSAVGIMGLCKFVPIFTFVLFGGILADRFNRRSILLITQFLWAMCCFMMWLFSYAGQMTPLMIYFFTVIIEIVDAFDGPARKSLIAKVVPKEILSSAVSFQSMTKNAVKLSAPVLMGVVILYFGIEWSYFVNAICFCLVILSMRMIPKEMGKLHKESKEIKLEDASEIQSHQNQNQNHPSKSHHHHAKKHKAHRIQEVFQEIGEGFTYLKNSPILLSILILDFLANFWANATVLLPAFSDALLKLNAKDFGILASAVAFGGLLASFFLVIWHEPQQKGKWVVFSSFLYGFSSLGFAFSQHFYMAFIALALLGFADQLCTVLRNTIHQNATPDDLRGRVTAINSLFTKGGPRLGELQAGALAGLLGISSGIAFGALVSLFCTLLVVLIFKELIGYRDEF